MTGGWETQLQRVQRWYKRALEAKDPVDKQDYLYAFFENAFHLRDWLENTGGATREDLNTFINSEAEMRLCRDLANSHKHYSISKPSQPFPPSEAREYAPNRGNLGNVSWIILSDGVKHDAFQLATHIIEAWEDFINTKLAA